MFCFRRNVGPWYRDLGEEIDREKEKEGPI